MAAFIGERRRLGLQGGLRGALRCCREKMELLQRSALPERIDRVTEIRIQLIAASVVTTLVLGAALKSPTFLFDPGTRASKFAGGSYAAASCIPCYTGAAESAGTKEHTSSRHPASLTVIGSLPVYIFSYSAVSKK